MVKRLLLVITIIYTVTLIVTSLIDLDGVPNLGSSFDDKIYHFLAYIALAFLWLTYFRYFGKAKPSFKVFIVVLMFAIFLELIQHQINPNRTFDVIDLLANCIGVVVGTLIAVKQSILKLK